MTEEGLCTANLIAYGEKKSLTGLPYMFLQRRIMEEAGTIEQALAIMQRTKHPVANSVILADTTSAVVAEVGVDKVVVRPARDNRVFATNNFVGLAERGTCSRYQGMVALLEKLRADGITVAEAHQILDAVGLDNFNMQSMVFLPGQRVIYVALGEAPAARGPFVRLDFAERLKGHHRSAGDEKGR
jgi:predicted choloylglycine hydrolase